jgi:Tol biopolymer transport system component/tRNA A-37 threonylcarbamoyl transferase component Bud32
MPLAPQTRLGPYEIVTPLGAGGMGEVYRARDTRLGREVAIKVLPPHLSRSPDFRARFEREAKTVSGLNHPHICTVHDVGREGDTDFLVMELIEGETLAHRLERGPLPMADVLRLGGQIADALDRAHRAGVVHRDLKPGNVMLTRLGAKLMDFGLARESDVGGPAGAALTVTKSQPLTAEGSIVGTFQYMAPERLEGKDADARSDVWALGCVLYEMATAKRAFEGKSQASLISAIMSSEPPALEQLAPLAPPALDRLVHACLAKDPDERVQTAHDVRLQLGWIAGDSSQAAIAKVPAAKPARSAQIAWAVAGVAVLAGLAGATSPLWMRPAVGPGGVMRFSIAAPEHVTLDPRTGTSVISPDGKSIVFVATDSSGNTRLWLRPLDALGAQVLSGTDNATLPFWSPDSRMIGFFADGKVRKVPVGGGSVETICDATDGRAGTWSANGTILFAPVAAGPLQRVSADGGDPVVIARPDSVHGENALRFPQFLPDGRHYLFVGLPPHRGQMDVFVGELGSDKRRLLMTAATSPSFDGSHHLVFIRGDRLIAQDFDPGAAKLSGQPVAIAPAPLLAGFSGAPGVSLSNNGIMIRTSSGTQNTQLQWLDASGRPGEVIPMPSSVWAQIVFSHDGRRAVVERYSDASSMDLYMLDLSRGLATRFTHIPSCLIFNEVWSPDDSKIAFDANPDGPFNIYMKSANGEGDEQLVYKNDVLFKNLIQWSPDGKALLFDQPDPTTGWNSWMLPLEGDHKPIPLLHSRFNEIQAQISPDGHWLLFLSDESGRNEGYVQSFPNPGPRYQVTTAGASFVGWRQDGKRIGILGADGAFYGADVQTTPSFQTSPLHFQFRPRADNNGLGASGDFQRFIQVVPIGQAALATIGVEVNWAAALEKR